MMPASFISKSGAVVALLVAIAANYGVTYFHNSAIQPAIHNVALERLPMQIGDWKGSDAGGLGIVPRGILKLDSYIRRIYKNSRGEEVFIYIGYWKKQSGEHQAAKHSPTVCLPANGWAISKRPLEDLSIPSAPHGKLTVNRLVGMLNHQDQYFHYWFFSGQRNYTQEWYALFNIVMESFLHGRSDGGIVELSTVIRPGSIPAEGEAEANKSIETFVIEVYPELNKLVNP